MKHISVYARFTRKNPGLGLRSTDWNFAKKEPVTLDVMIGMFAATLAEFYLESASADIDSVNTSLRKAEDQISKIYFEKVEKVPEEIHEASKAEER